MSSSSSKEIYNQRLDRLKAAQNKLIALSDQAEARFEPFRQLTEEYARKIRKHGIKRLPWYIKRWIRCFISNKDEIMVLITGEVIRTYHKTGSHKEFIHSRGADNAIYKRSEILSLCSVDGIDYEYRTLVEKYGEKSALTRVLDVHEPLGEKMNALYKRFDGLVKIILDSVNSLSPTKCQLDILHFAEKFLIIFGDETVLNEKGARFRNCSQAEGLSTVIEEHPDDVAMESVATKPQNKRVRSAFNFEDDEDDAPAAKVPVQEKKPDFHMDISLDDIKRAAGVSVDLLAKPTAKDYLLAEEAEVDLLQDAAEQVDGNDEQKQKDLAAAEGQCSIGTIVFQRHQLVENNPLMISKRVVKFKIIDFPAATGAGSSHSVHSASTSSWSHIPSQSSSSLSTQLEKIVPIVITSYDILLDNKERTRMSAYLSATSILDEITTYLWFGLSPIHNQKFSSHNAHTTQNQSDINTNSNNNTTIANQPPATVPREDRPHRVEQFQACLPIALQVESVQYVHGDNVPLPPEDRPKKYPVLCESCPVVLDLLRALQQWTDTPSPSLLLPTTAGSDTAVVDTTSNATAFNEQQWKQQRNLKIIEERWQKQELLVYNMRVIRYIAEKLRVLFQQMHVSEETSGHSAAHLVIDSRYSQLSLPLQQMYRIEDLHRWRKWVCEATEVILQRFTFWQDRCVFLYRSSYETVELAQLPFRYFSHVRCVDWALANFSTLLVTATSSSASTSDDDNRDKTTTSNNTSKQQTMIRQNWKLRVLDLDQALSLFQYLSLTYSPSVQCWRELLLSCQPSATTATNTTATAAGRSDKAIFERVVSALFPDVFPAISHTENISGNDHGLCSTDWSWLFRVCDWSRLSATQRERLCTQDPWMNWCLTMQNQCAELHQVVLPNTFFLLLVTQSQQQARTPHTDNTARSSASSSNSRALLMLSWLVCVMGLAVLVEKSPTSTASAESATPLEIKISEKLLRLLPEAVSVATEYLQQQQSLHRRNIVFNYSSSPSTQSTQDTAIPFIPLPL